MDRRLLVLALGMFALGTDSFVVAGVLPEISRSFGVSIGAAGQMTTIYSIAYALLAPVLATVLAGVPRKRLLLAGLGVFVIANLGTALAPTFGLAMATRALAGFGAAIFSPTAMGAAPMIVPPEKRGLALAVVLTGLTVSTATGSPIGTIIGGLGDWHWTMIYVAALAAISGLGVAALLSEIPMLPAISMKRRLAPLADARTALTLISTLLFFTGVLTVYTYFAVVFDRALGGNPTLLSIALVVWGLSGVVSNIIVGRLIDRVGSRKVLVALLSIVFLDFIFVHWAGASLWTSLPIIILWGGCGWGILVPQQHRIVTIAPTAAPILLGLNNSATFLGATAAGVIGAAGLNVVGAHNLGYVGAIFVFAALITSEIAASKIAAVERAATPPDSSASTA